MLQYRCTYNTMQSLLLTRYPPRPIYQVQIYLWGLVLSRITQPACQSSWHAPRLTSLTRTTTSSVREPLAWGVWSRGREANGRSGQTASCRFCGRCASNVFFCFSLCALADIPLSQMVPGSFIQRLCLIRYKCCGNTPSTSFSCLQRRHLASRQEQKLQHPCGIPFPSSKNQTH